MPETSAEQGTPQEQESIALLRRLITSRRAHRGQLTKLLGRAEACRHDEDNYKQDLQALVNSLFAKLETLKDYDSQINKVIPETELEDAIIEADDYQELSLHKVRPYLAIVNMIEAPMVQHNSTLNPMNMSHLSQMSLGKRKVNLPKLQLPQFDGNILKWTPYYDAFCAAVHNDENLDDIQKFQYLTSTLNGEAAHAIEGLQLTNANYEEALTVLRKRYGQPHKIIASYMKALWELPKPNEGISDMKDFYDNLETYVRGLRSLGKTEDSYGDLLIPIIFEKLPGKLKTQISRDHGSDNAWTLKELKDAIYREIQASEAGECESTDTMKQISSTAAFYVGSKTKHTENQSKSKPYTGYRETSETSTTMCVFCKGSHYPTECMKVTDKAKRYEIVKRDRLCFNCLRGNHRIQNCRSQYRCKTCRSKHHTALCIKESNQNSNQSQDGNQHTSRETPKTPASSEDTHVKLVPTGNPPCGPVLLKTASTKLWHNGKAVMINILLDEGAQRSFVTEETVQKLQVNRENCPTEHINLATFGHSDPTSKQLQTVQLKLEMIVGPKLDISALIVPKISSPIKNYVQASVHEHYYLRNIPLAQHVERDVFGIDLLIGADYYWSIVEDHTVRGPGPTAVASKLGYLLSGPTGMKDTRVMNTMICKVFVENTDADRNLSEYWNLETIGVKDEPDQKLFDYQYYRDNQLKLHNGKYTANLPWKTDHAALPTNYDVCYKRTKAMARRLSPDIRKVYNEIIADQLSRGFIETVSNDDKTCGHYIPHHAVYKDSATTPIRIVYDCSCKQGGNPSLNDCLDTGPCMINDLVKIMLRFRQHPIAFVSDIEKAFLNIRLAKEDRSFTKFLWLSDPNDPNSDLNVYQFKAILFGSVSSPFILNAVVKSHLERKPSPVTEDLQHNIYVDNVVSGVDTEKNAITYYNESVELLQKAGFKLRSWCTNSTELSHYIDKDNKDIDTTVKVLGMIWESGMDMLTFPQTQAKNPTHKYTKRDVVRVTASLFDPLGLVSPVHIKAKIFVQKLWSLHLQWDEAMQEDLVNEWTEICSDLDRAKQTKIDRSYFPNLDNTNDHELHVFSDASMKAYGAVVYIKRGCDVSFVMSKSRVRPLKDITLPRLELLAAVIATQVAQLVCKALYSVNFKKVILWSDSQIVLHWIKSDKKLPLFVENRVKTIRSGPFTLMNYCPTKDNPADLLTRGISYMELSRSSLWKSGPSWLPNGDWPICELFESAIMNCLTDCQTNEMADPHVSVNMMSQAKCVPNPMKVIDVNRFNSLGKLIRVTSYVLRFIQALKSPSKRKEFRNFITVPEMNCARNLWIKTVQYEVYSKEYKSLHKDDKVKTSLVRQLKLVLDDTGIIRCRGRLDNAGINMSARRPILLPSKHPLTRLVVKHYHIHMLHAGIGITTAAIRNAFWIPRIRQVVKSILRSCVTCLKVNGKPYKLPETPPLPKFRLLEAPPFTVCGVDFTGFLYYKSSLAKNNKAYICLFTCAVTRAVHLEVVTDMSTDSFIRAFRRFAGRCSLPQHMISDNGLTFIAGAETIRKLCNDKTVNSYLVSRNVKWTFIPKRAPWFGGFYERLIGITKTALKKMLGRTLVTLDELLTLVVEVEAIVNERPLTYTFTELGEPQPLTPSMLLYGRSLTLLPHQDVTEEELKDCSYCVNQPILDKRSKHLDVLIDQCWRHWKTDYLPQLREAHIANAKTRGLSTINQVKVGDVVLVHNDISKRSHWPLAIVTKLNYANDGLVRSVDIKTKRGVTNRPIAKLYPLEVSADLELPADGQNSNDKAITTSEVPIASEVPQRKRRQAAIGAKERIRKWTSELIS